MYNVDMYMEYGGCCRRYQICWWGYGRQRLKKGEMEFGWKNYGRVLKVLSYVYIYFLVYIRNM